VEKGPTWATCVSLDASHVPSLPWIQVQSASSLMQRAPSVYFWAIVKVQKLLGLYIWTPRKSLKIKI